MSNSDELIDVEKRFWQTMIDRDAAAATELMADSCIITGAQGVAQIDKASFGKMLEGGKWTLHDYSFDEIKVIRPTPDLAVVGYKVTEHVTVDGKHIELKAADASTWIRQGGSWVCVLHTESVLGDPFGRGHDAA